MFRNEIRSKIQWICFDYVRFAHGVAGCIGLAYGLAQMYLRAVAGRQVVLYIAFLDEAHGGSSRSVAYLKDARLERSLECRRREGENGLLLQAYAYQSLLSACGGGASASGGGSSLPTEPVTSTVTVTVTVGSLQHTTTFPSTVN
jgi:hypothetical protein